MRDRSRHRMYRFPMILAAVLMSVVATSRIDRGSARAQQAPPAPGNRPATLVEITNTPLPIQGNVGVTGNVDVTGNVSVVNTPTVAISPSANAVQISNLPSNPVYVQQLSQTTLVPYQKTVYGMMAEGEQAIFVTLPVPADGSLVVEHVSAEVSIDPRSGPIWLIWTLLTFGDSNTQHYIHPGLPTVLGPGLVNVYTMSQPVRWYVEKGNDILITVQRTQPYTGRADIAFSVSGQLF